jgi:hypothetical protein
MDFLNLPDPVSMLEAAANGKLEREIVNSIASAAYSAWISAMWRSGSAKWALFAGEGQALKDAATAVYLSLRDLEQKNFLVLTVPKDLTDPDNLNRFITQEKKK